MDWHQSLGLAPERLQFHQHDEGRARALRARGVRRAVRLRRHARLPGDRGRAQSRRLRPHAPPGVLGQEARVLRPAEQPALRAVRRRDVGGRGPHDARGARERAIARRRSKARTKAAPCSASHPSLAPIKAGVFPLVKKDGMPEMAEKLTTDLRQRFPVFYDESGAIGRRYRRQDEVGTPVCITVDGQIDEGRHRHDSRPRHAQAGARRGGPRRRHHHGAPRDSEAVSRSRQLRRRWRGVHGGALARVLPRALGTQGDRGAAADLREVSRTSSATRRSTLTREEFESAAEGSEERRGARLLLDWQVGGAVRARAGCARRAGDRVGGRARS